jgi:hypothetical protein
MTPIDILELPRPLGLLPTRKWSSNSLETNSRKLYSREFMMLPLMGGIALISIVNAIIRDGL